MPEPVVFLNDRLLPASQAHINIYDLGIVLGATLTEMTRTFHHKAFRLDDHLDRLHRSLKYANIHPAIDINAMRAATLELIEKNASLLAADEDLGVVHFVTPGENQVYAGSAAAPARLTPTVCIHSFPLPLSVWRPLITDGVHVVTPSIRHVPPVCVDPRMKNRSRLHWWLADQQTKTVDPKAITLLLDLEGNVTECAGSNFVVVKDRTIYSPNPKNILLGVSLMTVKELAPALGLSYAEKDLQVYDVMSADEAWLTTTPYCIAPATKINHTPIGDGKPGPWFHKMMDAWSQSVGLDIRRQIIDSRR
ncbi:MAG: aminotransferase class IV [Planctomycetes bacterium]|nr:aminotransferase class IV [Planctomycetota bacterium]